MERLAAPASRSRWSLYKVSTELDSPPATETTPSLRRPYCPPSARSLWEPEREGGGGGGEGGGGLSEEGEQGSREGAGSVREGGSECESRASCDAVLASAATVVLVGGKCL